jgi:hypothetical protein
MTRSARPALFASAFCAASLFAAPAALAQHGHGDGHGHSHGAGYAEPTSARAGVRQVAAAVRVVSTALDAGNLDDTHEALDTISRTGKILGRLALKPDSGVPRAKVREVNVLGKAVADAADAVHVAADKPDLAAARAAFGQLNGALTALTAAVPFQYQVKVDANSPLKGGKLKLALLDPAGQPVKGLRAVHEKELHLLIVSHDLSFYAHEHPKRLADGTFELDFTFPHGGGFTLYSDFAPEGDAGQVVATNLALEGPPPPPAKPLTDDTAQVKTINGYEFVVRCNAGKAVSGAETLVRFRISKDGQTVKDVENYLGELGHLVVVSADRAHFVHSHPVDRVKRAKPTDPPTDWEEAMQFEGASSDDVVFHAVFPVAGLYRGWAQFRLKGAVVTVPFTIGVEAGDGHGDHDHDHGDGEGMKKEKGK